MVPDADDNKTKIVIIGGVAGGASAAAKARRVNEHAEIVLFEKGPYVSFANCGLPYHIAGEIVEREDLFVVTKELLWARFNIDVRIESEVIDVDPQQKCLTVLNLSKNVKYKETYDKLIVATGANAVVPPIPGAEAKGVFTLKTIPDMDRIIALIEKNQPKSAVVIGGGFIGLEAAEALHRLGLEVAVAEAAPQILSPFDPDMADAIERYMQEELGIEVYENDPVEVIQIEGDVPKAVQLRSGEILEAEVVIMAIGVTPVTDLAKKAGLVLGQRNLIVVDDHMRTSDPDIYAVGDIVQTSHRVSGKPAWLPLAGPANRQGRTAGTNAAGDDAVFPGVLGTAIVRMGKISAARTGLNETDAKKAGLDFFTSFTSSKSHADYYPGAEEMGIKLTVENQTGRLLGAQIVGGGGVDKRIDIFSTALAAEMTVGQIVDLELAYAPPFGSAKDPVNLAAMTAENILKGISKTVTWDQHLAQEPLPRILDVRSQEERQTLYVKDTVHIPIDELRERLDELDKEAPLTLYCRIGQRGYLAEQILRARGFKQVKNISGGWRSIWGKARDEKLIGQES